MTHRPSSSEQAPLVFWIIWLSILIGLFVIRFQIGGGIPEGSDTAELPMGMIALLYTLLAASVVVRWLILPKASSSESLMKFMVIGVALAEGAGLLSILLLGNDLPETQRFFFYCSIVGIVQFVPTYCHKLAPPGGSSPPPPGKR
ncbi:MAG: hypothetical protein ACON38_20165 [Akkermansiaceae bacterium]